MLCFTEARLIFSFVHHQDFFTDCVSKDFMAPLSSKLSGGARFTLKSALQSAFQICAVLFDKPRDEFTDTLDRLGECGLGCFVPL